MIISVSVDMSGAYNRT